MKIRHDDFRGELPRYGSQDLPEAFAQTANSPRLLSGDLESWKSLGAGYTLPKGGDIVTIHHMERTNWLHWNASELAAGADSVDVARGPVLGDETERTYYTGTDAPRQTNILKATDEATNGNPGTFEYPYDSLLLGVPVPDDDPTVEQTFATVAEDEIPVDNADAESGTTTGWTITAGDLVATQDDPPAPHAGSWMFGGGAAASTVAIQRIDMTAISIFGDLSLRWWQAGLGVDEARMGIRFRDASLTLLTEYYADFSAETAWVQRELIAPVPEDAEYFDIVQEYQGTATIEQYIDDIQAFASQTEDTFDGDQIGDWDIVQGSNADVQSNPSVGNPAPSYWMRTNSTDPAFIHREFGVDESPLIEIEYEFWMQPDGIGRFFVGIGVDEFGDGAFFRYNQNGISLMQLTGWGAGGSVIKSESALIPRGPWHTATITATASNAGTNVYDVTVEIRDSSDVVLATIADAVTFGGGRMAFGNRSPGNHNKTCAYDNIRITAAPNTGDTDKYLDDNTRYTSYVYTYVNELGEEGPPSLPTKTIQYGDRIVNTVTMGTTAPAGYGVTDKRLYRVVSGELGAVYALVVELPLATATYADSKDDIDLGELLPSAGWDLPPTDGRGILALPNGITAMFSKNQFCPSVQYRPHAYPFNFRLATDYPIVGMGAIDTVVVVVTESNPYLVQGSTPETLSMQKLELPQGCVSKRGIVSLKGWGVIYPSPDGLVGVSGSASPKVITEQILSRREWQDLSPETIVGIAHDDRYFGFYDNGVTQGGFIFDPLGKDGFGWVWLDIVATALYSDSLTDTLYMVEDGDVVDWEGGAGLIAYTWRSRLWQLPHPVSFSCAQVKAVDYNDLTLKVYAGGDEILSKAITNSTEFNLPSVSAAEEWEIQLSGSSRVQSVELAEDMAELQ